MTSRDPIFKLVSRRQWLEAEAAGRFAGSEADLRDGFIHFSTGAQVRETAARHFANEDALLLVAVDTAALGSLLRWEPSRGGALFPHLYGDLDLETVLYVEDVPRGENGAHRFSDSVR